MFQNSSITLALKSIKNTLIYSLKENYNIENNETIENILKIHGLSKENFDFITNIETIIENNINDISIDSNSNKEEKTIEGIHQEVMSSIKKVIGYRYLYRELKDLFGKNEAKKITGQMYDFSLALADSTSILRPYCYAFDFSKLVTIGRDFGQLKSKPCKRISSYISALCETVHQLSNHLAGAVAIGTLFLDIANLLIYKENINLDQIKNDINIRKYIENEFQQLVHSLNHLSRNSNESPFSNISIFDREKLRVLLQNDNYEWYFPFDEKIYINNTIEDYKNYIIEFIMELQILYMDFFDKGDPLQNGAPYRFPISTICISYKEKDNEKIIIDKKFLNTIVKEDIYRYNIFASQGMKIASCCRLVSNNEMMELASQSNSFGAGGSISLGSHRVVTINLNRIALECKDISNFYEILNNRLEDTSKILKAHKQLILKLKDKGLQSFIKNGWININRMFSTYGLLGYYECIKTLNEKFKNNKNELDLLEEILIFINEKAKVNSEKYNLLINIETIPGESMAGKLCKIDKLLYNEEKIPYQLYSNQFIPLWENGNVFERMNIDGRFNQKISGGGIVHINIGEKITTIQCKKIIEYAIKVGNEHFSLNPTYSICENNHINFGKYETCPICNKKIKDYMTRVVGFYTKVSNWEPVRKNWEFDRRKFVTIE